MVAHFEAAARGECALRFTMDDSLQQAVAMDALLAAGAERTAASTVRDPMPRRAGSSARRQMRIARSRAIVARQIPHHRYVARTSHWFAR
jgi:hypothetical protein